MDISEAFKGKWRIPNEESCKNSSCIMFDGETGIYAREFMGKKTAKGYYIEGRDIFFLIDAKIFSYTIDISASGDVLTMTDSKGMTTEYIRCQRDTASNAGWGCTVLFNIYSVLSFCLAIMIIIIVVLLILG